MHALFSVTLFAVAYWLIATEKINKTIIVIVAEPELIVRPEFRAGPKCIGIPIVFRQQVPGSIPGLCPGIPL